MHTPDLTNPDRLPLSDLPAGTVAAMIGAQAMGQPARIYYAATDTWALIAQPHWLPNDIYRIDAQSALQGAA